jgi:hypothetical protein
MYTELNCAFSLKRDTPDEIVDVLLFMTRQDEEAPKNLPTHSFFQTPHWRDLLKGTRDIVAETYSNAMLELSETSGRYRVTIRCVVKNSDPEIAQFIDWIAPFILARPDDFIGYTRSQDVEPVTLLLYANRTITRQLPDDIDGESA